MSQTTVLNRWPGFAAATVITAMGLLTIPAPARAGPMLPLPLAPPCSQFGFTGGYSIKSVGWQTFMSSTGPATVGGRAAMVSDDNVTKFTGNVSGGIQGRKIDITFRGDNGAGDVHFTGTVDDGGFVHNGVSSGPAGSNSWDSINGPLGCTDAPPPAAPPPSGPGQQPAPPDAQTTVARLGVAVNGPTTLPAGQSGTYTVSVSNPGDVSAPVELFIGFNGQLQQAGFTPSGGFNCEVRNYAGGTSSVHCTVPQFQSKATTNITVQGRGSAPGAGQLVVNINSSDPGAQFVQKSQQLNITIT